MNKRYWRTPIWKCGLASLIVMSLTCMTGCGPKTDSAMAPAEQGNTKSGSAKKNGVTVWFVKAEGEDLTLVPVVRSKTGGDPVESAVSQLLAGPDDSESKEGISSEIPRGTILLGIEKEGDKIEVNLSQRFTSGGGPLSIQTRLDQLAKTVNKVAGESKVFLSIEGDRLSANQIDGLEIKQPIN